jgi:hypothetical protein
MGSNITRKHQGKTHWQGGLACPKESLVASAQSSADSGVLYMVSHRGFGLIDP